MECFHWSQAYISLSNLNIHMTLATENVSINAGSKVLILSLLLLGENEVNRLTELLKRKTDKDLRFRFLECC